MPFTTAITAVMVNDYDRTLSACFELNRECVAQHFDIEIDHETSLLFIDIVCHRIQETLFSMQTITHHRVWFVKAVPSILRDCGLTIQNSTEERLTTFAQDVMEEIVIYKREQEVNHA